MCTYANVYVYKMLLILWDVCCIKSSCMYTLYVTHTVGREVYSQCIQREVNILPRLYIEAIDQSTVFYVLYSIVSAQQMNLLPESTP